MINSAATTTATDPRPPDDDAADHVYVVVGVGEGLPADYDAALAFAADEASRRGISIKIVHGCGVGEHGKESTTDTKRIADGRRLVDGVARRLRSMTSPGVRVFVTNTISSAADALLDEASTAQLIVVQRRDLPLLRRLFSASTSAEVAARASCAVAVLTDGIQPAGNTGVVVGIDPEGRSSSAVRVAFDEAERRGVPLTAVCAWSLPLDAAYGYAPVSAGEVAQIETSAQTMIERAVASSRSRHPDVDVRIRLASGPPVSVLLAEARGADVLVVARHGESARGSSALGAKTRGLIAGANCPVIIAPPSMEQLAT